MKGSNRSAAMLLFLILGCGGSGSTGLITAESVLFEDVRQSNTCLDANETVYCPAAGVPLPTDELPLPGGEIPISPLPPGPEGCATCGLEAPIFVFDTTELPLGSACSVATRVDGGDWLLGELGEVGSGAIFEIVASGDSLEEDAFVEGALVCFESSRRAPLPSSAQRLSDLGPEVIFVAPELAGID